MKGSYALLLELDKNSDIIIGALGRIRFPRGYYVYVGSAMNGIEGRVRRHLRDDKKIHWHIDYLLIKAEIRGVYKLESKKRLECAIAGTFSERFDVIESLGASDCKCEGHLFFGRKTQLEDSLRECGMEVLRV